jgi:hypothetical protein
MYLYTCVFTDGTKVHQTREDQLGLTDGPNQYRQILQSGKKIALFTIKEQKLWNPTEVIVNLLTGNIIVNGIELHHEDLPAKYPDFELYWMQTVIQTMAIKHETKTGKYLGKKEMPEQRTYFVGWKTTIDGKEYQQIIGVK